MRRLHPIGLTLILTLAATPAVHAQDYVFDLEETQGAAPAAPAEAPAPTPAPAPTVPATPAPEPAPQTPAPAASAPPEAAGTEGTEEEEAELGGREANGHHFILSDFIPSPFTVTQFGLAVGGGFATIDAPEVDDQGNPIGTTTYSAAAMNLKADLQVGIADVVALRGSASGTALIGTNIDTILVVGGSAQYDLSAGATVSFPVGPVRLGGVADVGYNTTFSFSPLNAIASSIQQGRIDRTTLLTEPSTLSLSGGPVVAVGLHPTVGLYGHGRLRYDNTSLGNMSDSALGIDAGGALSVDLEPVSVPVGFLASYNLQHSFAEGASPAHLITAGLAYTGRRNLNLGVEGRFGIFSAGPGVDVTTYEAQFRMRYYWW